MILKKIYFLFFSFIPLLLFSYEPIDVVIPATKKDIPSLNACIDGIRANCKQIRRIIVISPERYTYKADWYDERDYPFSKFDIALYLNQGDAKKAKEYAHESHSRVGWYYQQLLKLYAPFVIPGISSNVLILDADTIFLRSVQFIDNEGMALYNTGTEYHEAYFEHFKKVLPDYEKVFLEHSGISHHMLFQRHILEEMFQVVEGIHNNSFWKVFCSKVDPQYIRAAGASEYEIYFNFAFTHSDKVKIRQLKWKNAPAINEVGKKGLNNYYWKGYDYVSCHKYD